MDDITQKLFEQLDYHDILSRLLESSSIGYPYPDQAVTAVVNIIALASGLGREQVLSLKWSAIYEMNSRGLVQVRKELDISRYYSFPINRRLVSKLIELYGGVRNPELDNRISDAILEGKRPDDVLSLNLSLGLHPHVSLDEMKSIENIPITQKLFGRRVIEVCGKTSTSMKFLKSILGFKTNDEILTFLEFKPDHDFDYKLYDISMVDVGESKFRQAPPPSHLDENKHFFQKMPDGESYYPFEDFQVFYDFLDSSQSFRFGVIEQCIDFLLMLGLCNGIRLSKILSLRWKDVIDFGDAGMHPKMRHDIIFLGHRLRTTESMRTKCHSYFRSYVEKSLDIDIHEDDNYMVRVRASLDVDAPCFVTNLGNPLTTNSLLREVRGTLETLGYRHSGKFTTKSTMVMFGRRLIDIKGYHKPTIQALKTRFGYRSERELFEFLHINVKSIKEHRGVHKPEFDQILYDL